MQSTIQDKRRIRPMQHSIIDKLIEEALFEFTSLQEGSALAQGLAVEPPIDMGSAPLSLDKFQPGHDWAREITIQDRGVPSPRTSAPPHVLEAGNLAALEDDDDEPPPARKSEPRAAEGGPSQRPLSITPAGDSIEPASPVALKKGSSSAVAFVVVLVVLVVMAGAYYTGLLPGVAPPR